MCAEVDGQPWVQEPYAYQVKCLAWLREAYEALDAKARAIVDPVLTNSGLDALFMPG